MIDVYDKKPFFLAQSIGDSALQVNGKGFASYGIPPSRIQKYRVFPKTSGSRLAPPSTGLGPDDEL